MAYESDMVVENGYTALIAHKSKYLLETLTLFGLGFLPTCKNRGGGGGDCAPPNLAISSKMRMKLGRDMLWVKIFLKWQKVLMTSLSF